MTLFLSICMFHNLNATLSLEASIWVLWHLKNNFHSKCFRRICAIMVLVVPPPIISCLKLCGVGWVGRGRRSVDWEFPCPCVIMCTLCTCAHVHVYTQAFLRHAWASIMIFDTKAKHRIIMNIVPIIEDLSISHTTMNRLLWNLARRSDRG